MKNIIILYSGGLDSYILYQYAKKNYPNDNIKAIYWNYYQDVAKIEISKLPNFVEIRNLDWMNLKGKTSIECPGRNEGPIFIPGRNLVFAVLCACEDLPDEIWLGTLAGETHNKGTDKNYQFLWNMNATLNYVLGPFLGEKKIECKFPLADAGMNKLDCVNWALNNGITKEELISTYSCHSGKDIPCGECVQCIKRWSIFGQNGFTEKYNVNPATTKQGLLMFEEMIRCKLGGDNPYYNQESIQEILPFFMQYALKNQHLFDAKLINNIVMVKNLKN
ncbi:7-cyano-7-deazaguanine synthase [Candidatus Gracilibacteria bacterium]|jgi:7-cyano-7-deazaguanine synthase in queuosine biosynthesis|nr:7-cyano-7-deazaguanine synthase [Candidatus Gracilibacteria bacterium]